MKKITRILITTLSVLIMAFNAYSQKVFDIENVGVGTTSPTEKLDVVGNVKFSKALMPNDLPGTVGNILLSQGSATSPIWLANGSTGQVLTISSGVPTWSTPDTGSVISITAGTGLSGGTIISSGTISITATGIDATSYGDANDFTTFTVNAEGQLTTAGTEPLPTSLPPSGTASGDLSGTYPNPAVAKINGVALGSTTATLGNLLIANGTNWVTEAMSGDATITSTGTVTVDGLLGKPISPTTLSSTDILEYNGTNWVPITFPTSLAPSGTAGGDLSGTYPNPAVAKINGVALGSTTATTGNLLIANGTNWVTEAMSGDATTTSSGVVTVKGLQGTGITISSLGNGQILEYNGTNWVNSSGSGQFIQNQKSTAQSSANFDISGSGQVGTTMTVDSNLETQGFEGRVDSIDDVTNTTITLSTDAYFLDVNGNTNSCSATLPTFGSGRGQGHTIYIRNAQTSGENVTIYATSPSFIVPTGTSHPASNVSMSSKQVGTMFIYNVTNKYWYQIF